MLCDDCKPLGAIGSKDGNICVRCGRVFPSYLGWYPICEECSTKEKRCQRCNKSLKSVSERMQDTVDLFNEFGVDLYSDDSYKTIDTVFKDLFNIWPNLDRESKEYIAWSLKQILE